MKCPKIALFDLDETLAESFQAPSAEMIVRLSHLLESLPIAIITGAGFSRINDGILSRLPESEHLGRLYILPNSSSQGYTWADGWNEEYNLTLSEADRLHIREVLNETMEQLPLVRDTEYFGERIADRDAQIAFTIVGLDAPQDIKMSWDPTVEKRREIREYLLKKLPEFDIRTGGASTIDITHQGVNKAYGVRWLAERLKFRTEDMLYIGDALYEGGNDYVVIPTGIQTIQTKGPSDTARIIDELLVACSVTE